MGLYSWPPFSFIDERTDRGIDVDLAHEISKRVGFTVKIRVCPFSRCLKEMESGKLDLMSGIALTPERAEYMEYAPSPYAIVSVIFLVRKGDEHLLESFEDLYHLRIGQVSDAFYFDRFNEDEKLKRTEIHHERQLPKMLHSGRIDTFVSHDPTAAYEIKSQGLKGQLVQAPYTPEHEIPIYFAVSRRSPHNYLLPAITQAISDIHGDGTMETILQKYR